MYFSGCVLKPVEKPSQLSQPRDGAIPPIPTSEGKPGGKKGKVQTGKGRDSPFLNSKHKRNATNIMALL